MDVTLLNYVVCPYCKSNFKFQSFLEQDFGIEEGLLSCPNCQTNYPIIKGIPRILPPELLPELVSEYTDFLHRYNLQGNSVKERFTVHNTDKTIAKGFEFEWKRHSEVLPEHEFEFLHVLGEVIPTSELQDKVILDAGCGQGRFSYFALKYGAKMVISFDLGEQVLISKRNLQGKANSHLVQASINEPPFKPIFDLVFSIGVIHHLPKPEEGFRTLFNLLKPDGKLFIWIYGYSSIIPIIKTIRKITLSLPLWLNRFLALFFAVPLYLLNCLYVFLKTIGAHYLADKLPWTMYYDRNFSNIWTITFDKMNSAIAFYYRREELEGWLKRLPDKQTCLLSERYPGKSGSSWRVMVQK